MNSEIADDIPFKTLLVDAIAGAGFPDTLFFTRCEALGLARNVGNQHNEHWVWLKGELYRCMREDELQLLYYSIKNFKTLTSPQQGAPA